jgi:cyclic lactone autoinducer peptide
VQCIGNGIFFCAIGGEKIKRLKFKLATIVPALALIVAVGSAQAGCWIFFNQPDVPPALKKYDE